ncbi:MAG: hypothetical protein ACOCUA_02635, partial [archaeon]
GEETIVLEEEFERLDDRLSDLTERIDAAEESQQLMQIASNVQTRFGGVSYLCDEFGSDAEVTVRGLTAGEYAAFEDKTAQYSQEADGPIPGARKNVYAAAGLVDGPFEDLEEAEGLDDYLAIVAQQPVGVRDWIHHRVDDLTTVSGDDFRPLSERLAALRE